MCEIRDINSTYFCADPKEAVATPIATGLRARGVDVWFDEFAVHVGDSIRRSIDRGLVESTFGLVILSRSFFAKGWTQYELDGLVQKELMGAVTILPIWHGVTHSDVFAYSPSLADKFAIVFDGNIPRVVDAILAVLRVREAELMEKAQALKESRDVTRLDLLRDRPTVSDRILRSDKEETPIE